MSHASVGSLLKLASNRELEKGNTEIKFAVEHGSVLDRWLNGIFTKICLSVDSDEELVDLYNALKERAPQIPCVLITDCGKTEFHGIPTNTCVGIGPWWSDEIDNFTHDLKLL